MRRFGIILLSALPAFLAFSCQVSPTGSTGDAAPGLSYSALTISPVGLPDKLLLGLFENPGQTWMKNSAVPWSARYCYLTKGWVNNWGWSAYDGSWALNFMKESDGIGAVPVVEFYQMNGEAGGGEAQFLAKAQNAATMKGYFGDFKLLMQRAKDFGKPVYVELEADGYAFLQAQTGGNPNTAAAVASTGLPELAGLPNTVAGWGLAFLAIKKAVGADNAFLCMHVSGWASGKDLFNYSYTVSLQPEVDNVYAFLSPLGLASNATGIAYDGLVSDPCDRDADFYRLTQNDGGIRWWDTSSTASISSRSMNRYREWLRLWNAKSGKRWLLWQIPLGNSNHLNVYNNGGAREGYKDNRPEYFLGNGGLARAKAFADAGVIALLFGAGAGGQSSYGNDIYTDGKSFMQSRGASFFAAGGVSLSGGSTGTPIALPGRIQAEDYKAGGEGVGYHDLSAGNAGGKYRTDNVDIEATTDAGGGYNVGWIDPGEWLAYDVAVGKAGLYTLTLRMASATAGTKTAALSVDGTQAASFAFTDASGWQSWKSIQVSGVRLAAGNHSLRIAMATGGFNINWLDAAYVSP
ncbi:MAG: carbohydrate-binding protein [Fibrobacteres bacterium]|nr:carbohydrate-binding protein [Fibrobacterota bacterium]